MRRVALGCLLATAGLAVVSAATALSTRAPEEFNQTLTLAGGPEAGGPEVRAPADDPEAPIATARYGGERSRVAAPVAIAAETHAVPAVATMALAGGPQDVSLASAAPAVAVADARTTPPSPSRRRASGRANFGRDLSRPAPSGAGPHACRAIAARPARFCGCRSTTKPLAFTPMGLQSGAVKRLTLNASNLMSKASASAEDLRRGRWMLYAASSGKAYGLNLIRDTFGGWRQRRLQRREDGPLRQPPDRPGLSQGQQPHPR